MKKIGIAVMILAVIGVAVTAGVFVTGHPETTKVEQKHEKIKKEGKAYAGKYRMNILLDTNNKVLSGTVRAKLKNATDDNLKSICVRNWAAAILQEKNRISICRFAHWEAISASRSGNFYARSLMEK